MAHLHDGNMFGEVAFLLSEADYVRHKIMRKCLMNNNFYLFLLLQPCLNYVATEETVLLVLIRTDFMKILAETPKVLSEMRRRLKEKFLITEKMTDGEMIETLKKHRA